jgi:hypothetical protein
VIRATRRSVFGTVRHPAQRLQDGVLAAQRLDGDAPQARITTSINESHWASRETAALGRRWTFFRQPGYRPTRWLRACAQP